MAAHPKHSQPVLPASIRDSREQLVFDIRVEQAPDLILCRWYGLISDAHAAHAAADLMLEAVNRFGISDLINDNSAQLGPWPNQDDWRLEQYNHRLYEAGLRRLAQVLSPSLGTELSTRTMFAETPFQVGFFASEAAARKWLRSLD